MSYCRWSNDDFQCDVYVYESVGDFYAIHIAGSRVTPPAETRPAPLIGSWWSQGEAGIAAYMARSKAVEAWLAAAERKPIELPHAGEMIREPDAETCAAKLEYLRGLGYNVPQYAIDGLRETAKEQEAEDHAQEGRQG